MVGVAKFIDTEYPHFGIVVDLGCGIQCPMDLGGKIEGCYKCGGEAPEDSFIAEGRGDMGFIQTRITNEDEIKGTSIQDELRKERISSLPILG